MSFNFDPQMMEMLASMLSNQPTFGAAGSRIFGGQNDLSQMFIGAPSSVMPPLYAQTGFNTLMSAAQRNLTRNNPTANLQNIQRALGLAPAQTDAIFQLLPMVSQRFGGTGADIMGSTLRAISSANPLFGTIYGHGPETTQRILEQTTAAIQNRMMSDNDGLDRFRGIGGARDIGDVLDFAISSGRADFSSALQADGGIDTTKFAQEAEKIIGGLDDVLDLGRRIFGRNTPAGEALRRIEALTGTLGGSGQDEALRRVERLANITAMSGGDVGAMLNATAEGIEMLTQTFGISSNLASTIETATRGRAVGSRAAQAAGIQAFNKATSLSFDTPNLEDVVAVQRATLIQNLANPETVIRMLEATDRHTRESAEGFFSIYGANALDFVTDEVLNKEVARLQSTQHVEDRLRLVELLQSRNAISMSAGDMGDFFTMRFDQSDPALARKLREAATNKDDDALFKLTDRHFSPAELQDLQNFEIAAAHDNAVADPANMSEGLEGAMNTLDGQDLSSAPGSQRNYMDAVAEEFATSRGDILKKRAEERDDITLSQIHDVEGLSDRTWDNLQAAGIVQIGDNFYKAEGTGTGMSNEEALKALHAGNSAIEVLLSQILGILTLAAHKFSAHVGAS